MMRRLPRECPAFKAGHYESYLVYESFIESQPPGLTPCFPQLPSSPLSSFSPVFLLSSPPLLPTLNSSARQEPF